ncbi:MAG: hypothetical protein K6T83_08080, partial [Alicyclobacillus sp.]|nr:hypothetical protein [Alicyclobacillus sp.]
MLKRGKINRQTKMRASVALVVAGTVTAMAAGVPASARTTSVPPLQITGWTFPQLPSYNMFAPNFINAQPLTNLPLAYPIHPQMTWVPMLASSWSINGNRMVIHLRTDAKWSNGDPFTSTDVLDTFALCGAMGWGTLTGVTGATAPNSHEVILTLAKDANKDQVLGDILGTYFVPASQYQQFVTKDLLKDALISSSATPASPAPASILKAEAKVKAALLKYNPSTYIGTGAFTFKSITTNMVQLTKNNYFYDANKIQVQQINHTFRAQDWHSNWKRWRCVFAGIDFK